MMKRRKQTNLKKMQTKTKRTKKTKTKRQRRLRDDPDKTMTMKGDRMFTGIYILRLLMVWTVPLR